jgi:hypothetical protein
MTFDIFIEALDGLFICIACGFLCCFYILSCLLLPSQCSKTAKEKPTAAKAKTNAPKTTKSKEKIYGDRKQRHHSILLMDQDELHESFPFTASLAFNTIMTKRISTKGRSRRILLFLALKRMAFCSSLCCRLSTTNKEKFFLAFFKASGRD